MPEERRPRGVTPCPRSGAAAKSARLRRCRNSREELPKLAAGRSYTASEVRGSGQEELPHVRGQGPQPGGPTPTPPHPRPGAAAGRTNPTSKEPWLRGHRKA